ncbi:uncharacterized protein LOC133891196 [Phragmites australis]|uniref:uncharacterized protein LOC133891196 n=1 Tax=Phragmites australis TaxID=29695 RepID=UPI002D771791|nr:uncharacterized protein LOC133891196 [Phragmites australis]
MEPTQSARDLWVATEGIFRDNRETRIIYQETEFRSLLQGDMSVTDYCRRLKGLTDSLRVLGESISDRTLVLNLIHGLSPRFATQAELLPLQDPFPSFAKARSALLLAEMRHPANTAALDGDTALFAASSSGQGNSVNKGKNNKGKGKGKTGGDGGRLSNGRGGGDRSNSGGQKQTSAPTPPSGPWVLMAPWASAPWAGPQLWAASWRPAGGPRFLGPRPTAQAQHAFHTQLAPPASVAGSEAPPQPAWDQASLVAALNNLHVQGQSSGGWVMDTGATSHMASSDGSTFGDRDSTLQ